MNSDNNHVWLTSIKIKTIYLWFGFVSIIMSEWATVVELEGIELQANAVIKLHPCWLNKFNIVVCVVDSSANLGHAMVTW